MKPLITIEDCSNKELAIQEYNFNSTVNLNTIVETIDIRVTVKYNCCQEYTLDLQFTPDNASTSDTVFETDQYRLLVYANDYTKTKLYLKPAFFTVGDDTIGIPDGIYTVTIEIVNGTYNPGSTLGDIRNEVFTYCAFVDCETQCKVADKIDLLLKEDKDTDIHMIHYALTINSDCYCHCDDMCDLYKQLVELLDDECLHKTCTSCH